MNLVTAIAILMQQVSELSIEANQLISLTSTAESLVNQENSVTEVDPQVHALTANMNIVVASIHSQMTIVQQFIDKVAELSNT